MIIATTDTLADKTVLRTLGIVKGSTVRARHAGQDIMAGLRNLVGGEIKEYAKLMAESREVAMERMVEEAEKMGANAIIGVRFTTSIVMIGASEILVYGTAVVAE